MQDLIGRTLGHYRITDKIGEGGMGEVYRAHDERLDRDVAVKVLAEAVAEDVQRLARFEREAKLLASLSHQNVATLHGLEVHDGQRFLVMELAEGETLAERIKKGPIVVEDALEIARQIAEGLEAAHEFGIIQVSPEEKVKVLDFGLAKAWHPDESNADLTHSPTLTGQMTAAGVLLGTAAYMSPEQARGKAVDKRADVWAFGCTLYEMLTGTRPFSGTTSTEILATIIKDDPDWEILPAQIPDGVRRLLRRCLTKDPRDRLHDIADARIEIEVLGAHGHLLREPIPFTAKTAVWHRVLPWGVAAVAVLVAVGNQLLVQAPSTEPTPRPVRRTMIALPDSEPVALAESAPLGVGRPSLALSPDGNTLVYVARVNGETHLSLRAMDKYETGSIPGTEGAFNPFFSPDGRWVGFFTETKLKKVGIPGEQVVTLCEARNPVGGSWSREGWVYFADRFGAEILRVSANGGPPESIREKGSWPRLLPNQRFLLVTQGHVFAPYIAVIPLDGGEARTIIERGGDARYLPTGHLLFAREGKLLAAPFDLERLEVTGPTVPVIDGVRTELRDGAQAALSRNGVLVFVPGPPGTEVTPVWMDINGQIKSSGMPSGIYTSPRISPDGGRLAIISAELNPDVWVYDLNRKTMLRITREGQISNTAWTPDGLWVIYSKTGLGIFRRRANGVGEEERLVAVKAAPISVTPDGEILITSVPNKGFRAIPLKRGDSQGALADGSMTSALSRLSPDGRWIAITSSKSGRAEVYVEPYPPTGERWMVSSNGGEEPIWSPQIDEVYYRYGNKWMAVAFKTKPEFSAAPARLLFEGNFANSPGYSHDIHPDGQRFLLFQRREQRSNRLLVIDNWFEELKRAVPTD